MSEQFKKNNIESLKSNQLNSFVINIATREIMKKISLLQSRHYVLDRSYRLRSKPYESVVPRDDLYPIDMQENVKALLEELAKNQEPIQGPIELPRKKKRME